MVVALVAVLVIRSDVASLSGLRHSAAASRSCAGAGGRQPPKGVWMTVPSPEDDAPTTWPRTWPLVNETAACGARTEPSHWIDGPIWTRVASWKFHTNLLGAT